MSEARAASGPHEASTPTEYTTATGPAEKGAQQRSAVRVQMEDVARPACDLVRLSETRRYGRRLTRCARLPDAPGGADEEETSTP